MFLSFSDAKSFYLLLARSIVDIVNTQDSLFSSIISLLSIRFCGTNLRCTYRLSHTKEDRYTLATAARRNRLRSAGKAAIDVLQLSTTHTSPAGPIARSVCICKPPPT